jgi:hypothetical protein
MLQKVGKKGEKNKCCLDTCSVPKEPSALVSSAIAFLTRFVVHALTRHPLGETLRKPYSKESR